MAHRVTFLLVAFLLTLSAAQYSLRFPGSGAAGSGADSYQLQYTYQTPVDFADMEIRFTLTAAPNNDFVNVLTIESTGKATGIYDFITIEVTSNNILVTASTPKSSSANEATTFCINSAPTDLSAETQVVVTKAGPKLSLSIDGVPDQASYFCQDVDIGEPVTGIIPDISKVTVSKDFAGCISQLKIGALDLLPEKCGFPLDFVENIVTYVEGTCGDGRTYAVECPTTPLPTLPPRKPTKEPTDPPKPDTQPPKPETDPPKPETDPPKLETDPPKPETDAPKPETEPAAKPDKPDNQIPATEPSAEEEPDDKNESEETKDPGYEVDNNESTELEIDAEVEAAKGDKKLLENNNNPLMIIIGVVAAGVILVVVLLYVGYKFHFRDKGSYKLEDGKTEEKEEFGNNEYAELNPSNKDQEWYL